MAKQLGKATRESFPQGNSAESGDAMVNAGNGHASVSRVYAGQIELDHDLFKLSVAKMYKNVSWDADPHWERFEHCHIFHTIDSNGKKQTTCSPVGGHFHVIETTPQAGGPPKLAVSPPMRMIRIKQGKKWVTRPEPIEYENPDHSHTHEVQYLRSQRIKPRALNAEFAKMDAAVRAKENPSIPGVIEG